MILYLLGYLISLFIFTIAYFVYKRTTEGQHYTISEDTAFDIIFLAFTTSLYPLMWVISVPTLSAYFIFYIITHGRNKSQR